MVCRLNCGSVKIWESIGEHSMRLLRLLRKLVYRYAVLRSAVYAKKCGAK